MTGREDEVDVVVVGAGSSGATLAARLSEQPSRTVLLVEAGPDHLGDGVPDPRRDPDRLPGAGDPWVERTPWRGGTGPSAELLTGRVVGGSGAVNGAYFVRPTDADLDRWAAAGNDHWLADVVLPAMRRLETDAELGGGRHGDSGPVPVTRHAAPLHPVTESLFAACEAAGHPANPDLNGGGAPGWGLVPRNVDGRGRVSAAAAYIDPARNRANLVLRTGSTVRSVLVERGRAVGVEVTDAGGVTSVVRAGTVVLCAGALGSPAVLLRSGIGPADLLARAGTTVVADVPAVGTTGENHPAVDLFYEPTEQVADLTGPLLQGALHVVTPTGATVELLAMCRPYGQATGDAPGDRTLSMRVSAQAGASAVRLEWAGGAPTVVAAALEREVGRRVLRDAVRAATSVATSPELSGVVATWLGPDPATLATDRALDAWITAHLGTSMHLCSTAPMGPDGDVHAAVDQVGRVRGVEGLRVVDLSILPSAPARGPACTAVALAEHLADTFG